MHYLTYSLTVMKKRENICTYHLNANAQILAWTYQDLWDENHKVSVSLAFGSP